MTATASPPQHRDVLSAYAGPLGCRGYMFRRLGPVPGNSITSPAFFRATTTEREHRAALVGAGAAGPMALCPVALPSSLLEYWPYATQLARARARMNGGPAPHHLWDRAVTFPEGRRQGGAHWRGPPPPPPSSAYSSANVHEVEAALRADLDGDAAEVDVTTVVSASPPPPTVARPRRRGTASISIDDDEIDDTATSAM